MIKPSNTYFVEMTPALAEQWVNNFRYDKQRTVRRWRVNKYAEEMSKGEWLPGYPLQLGVLNGKRVCTDGQHRQLAVIASQTTQTFTVIELECETETDVANLYYKTDRNMARSAMDMYRTTDMSATTGMNSTQLSALSAAVALLHAKFGKISGQGRLSDAALHDQMLHYADACGCYFEVTEGHPQSMRKALLRSPVVAVAITTFHYAVSKFGSQLVEDFWRGMALDDGLRQGDPRKVANDHLRTTNLGNGRSEGAKTVLTDYQARYLANCWNKWVKGESYSTNTRNQGSKVFDVKAPIVIDGTPWNGNL